MKKEWDLKMNELYNLGFNELQIKQMLESNPEIADITTSECMEKIVLLQKIGCNTNQIRNILIGNPWYFDRCNGDVIKVIQKLEQMGLEAIYLMINENPMLLNVDVFEIDYFVNQQLELGYTNDEIIGMIDENSNVIIE